LPSTGSDVDYATLLGDVERGQIPPVALLHGPETLLLDDALALISGALFPDAGSAALGRDVLDARDTSAEAIVRTALTLPFLGGTRLVAVKHAQALPAKQNEALVAYLRAPNGSTCLLLLADEPLQAQRDRREHWLLGAVPARMVIEVSPRKGSELPRWLQQRARRDGIEVDENAARLLAQLVGDDLASLLAETHKAALAGGPDNRRVSVAQVRAVVGAHRLSGIFELTNAVERGQVGPALTALVSLLAAGEEPLRLLGLLTTNLRTTWTIKDAVAQGQSAEQIARALRRPRPVVDTLVARAAAVPVAELARRLQRCWAVEQRLKSGGEPLAEMTVLIASLC
jgi:DNA polymerase III subunit delta